MSYALKKSDGLHARTAPNGAPTGQYHSHQMASNWPLLPSWVLPRSFSGGSDTQLTQDCSLEKKRQRLNLGRSTALSEDRNALLKELRRQQGTAPDGSAPQRLDTFGRNLETGDVTWCAMKEKVAPPTVSTGYRKTGRNKTGEQLRKAPIRGNKTNKTKHAKNERK